jgi:5-methyltetrahydropteroyltriglutamate--homocysteine methyltransferase
MRKLPLFPVTVVGSWPRPPELLRAQRRFRHGDMTRTEFELVADAAVIAALEAQVAAGVDLVSDGEQRRDNFYSFVADKLEGVRLMSLAEMLDVVEDRAGFERLLQTLDVPAYSIHSPTCVGPVRRREPLALDEYRFLRAHTDLPIKVPLPGPYLLTRAMWVKEVTGVVYGSKEELAADVVALLREEIAALADAGADFVQLDEPVLTEVAFNPSGTRTFMCAALAARSDPAEELEWAVSLINQVLEGFDGGSLRTGLHVCRGNWSRDERTLLAGSYAPLAPYLGRIRVGQLVLEFATPRAGELESLLASEGMRTSGKELGLGAVNPRTDEVETVEQVVARAEEALRFLPPDRLFLNPDCGFGTFSSRPMNAPEVARRKLEVMARAADVLRGRQ